MTHRTLATLLATILLVGAVAPAAAAAVDGGASTVHAQAGTQTAPEAQTELETQTGPDATTASGAVNVTVGQQLSTLVAATDGDVRSEVEATTFELEFEAAGDDERARAVAVRAEELASRAVAIRADYEDATRAHEAGEIDDSEYAERLASLNARAEDVAESVSRLRGRAAGVSAIELRAEGLTAADLRAIDERLDVVTGAGPAALLERFTGRAEGEVRIETRAGLEIRVEREDGELSREVERPRDGSTNVTVAQADALARARAELGEPPEGRWTLERASVHDDSGYYEFEFALTGANATGEAEVRVDGSSGEVFRLEAEVEAPDRDEGDGGADSDRDGEDGDDERDDGDDLALLVAEGTPGPGETVTLLALSAGDPVADAPVTLNGEPVGTTDGDGRLRVTLPADEAELRVEAGDADGELEFEFGEAGREDRELRRHFDATATVEDESATLRLTYDGAPVEGATVVVEGREVGTTGPGGSVTFDADGSEDLEVEVRKGAFGADLEFEARGGSLTLVEVEFEDVEEDDRSEAEDDETDADDGTDARDPETERERESEAGGETEDPETPASDDGREDAFDGDLAVEVVEGAREPGATVTVEVTGDGSPVADATVFLNDGRVGATDDDGRVRVTLPDGGRVEIVAEYGSEDAELEFEFGDDSSGSGEDVDDDDR